MKNLYRIAGVVVVFAFVLVLSINKGEAGPLVSTIAGQKATAGTSDGTGTAAQFSFTGGITSDGTNIYVADANNHTIRKVDINTAQVTSLAGTAGLPGSSDGIGTAALFNSPKGITTDGSSLYIADTNNYTIRKIDLSTGAVSTLAGTAGTFGSNDGAGSAALFGAPSGITTDGANLYVADTWKSTIRKIVINSGEVTTLAGKAGVMGSSDGTGMAARFNYPTGIATDGTNVYALDNGSHTVRKIAISTGVVTTLAGTPGMTGSSDGTGGEALFNYPQGITTDGVSLYIADAGNLIIRKVVVSTGEVTTFAGAAGKAGFTDGDAADARFGLPFGVTMSGASFYVTDMGAIRKIQ